VVDSPAALADRRARVEARIALASLARLAPLLEDSAGEADCVLEFHRDVDDRIVVEGQVTAALWQQCQRCLEPVRIDVRSDFRLAVVDDDRQAAVLPDGLEPVFREGRLLNLAAMVEDELLMGLPQIARHALIADCGEIARVVVRPSPPDAGQTAPEPERRNPFEVLKKLKGQKKT
jgi:uncharacterized protein